MKRCETCRHWDRPDIEGRPGQCQRIEPLDPYVAEEREKRKTEVAFIDAEDGYGWMQTRADFGCALWEEE